MEDNGVIHILADAIQNMKKQLECSICLSLFVAPVRARCGHLFCEQCIGQVVGKKGAKCPLCKQALSRRSVFHDGHVQACVDRLQNLISAAEMDTGIDVLSFARSSTHTKECNTPKLDRTSGNTQDSTPAYPTYVPTQQSASQNRGKSKNGKKKATKSPTKPLKKNECIDMYLQRPSTSYDTRFGGPLNEEEQMDVDKTMEMPEDDNVSCVDNETSSRLSATGNEIPSDVTTIYQNKRSSRTSPSDDRQIGTVAQQRSSQNTSQQKDTPTIYKRRKGEDLIHGTKPMEIQLDTSRIETNNASNMATNTENLSDTSIQDKSSFDKPASSNQSWSQVRMFGKDMRKRKRKQKMGSLDVSIESGKRMGDKSDEVVNENNPTTWREVELQSTNRIGRTEPNLPEKEKSTLDNERLPNPRLIYPQATSTPKNTRDETGPLNNSRKSTPTDAVMSSSFVTLEEGTQIRIKSLSDLQMKDILGITHAEKSILEDKEKPLKKRSTPYKDLINMQNGLKSSLTAGTSINNREQISPSLEHFATPRSVCLKEQKTDVPRSKSSLSTQDSPRLASVKRDLSREISQIKESTAPTSNRPVCVAFKKLGKITMHKRAGSRNPCKFLFLGSCKRARKSNTAISSSVLESLRPCNTVDTRTPEILGEPSELGDSFENNTDPAVTIVAAKNNDRRKDLDETLKVSNVIENAKVKETYQNKNTRSNTINDIRESRIPDQESIDVQFESQLETTLKKTPPANTSSSNKPNNDSTRLEISLTKNRTLVSGVKMISPEKDSQLRFLSTDSPTTDSLKRQSSMGSRHTKDNTPEVKGLHSKELLRRSQQSNNTDTDESVVCRKRKRPSDVEKVSRDEKKRQNDEIEVDGAADSDASSISIFSAATQKITTSNLRVIKSSGEEGEQPVNTMTCSTDTEILSDNENPPLKKKKIYKRIRHASSSSADSVEVVYAEPNTVLSEKNSGQQLNCQILKSTHLPDTNEKLNIAEIAERWCTDAYARGRYTTGKKNNGENLDSNLRGSTSQTIRGKALGESSRPSAFETHNSSRLNLSTANDMPPSAKDLFDSAPYSTERSKFTDKAHEIQEAEDMIVEENDECNSIIDRVRQMQKAENNRVSNNPDIGRGDNGRDESSESYLLHDNFNDIIANVDTADFMDDVDFGLNKQNEAKNESKLVEKSVKSYSSNIDVKSPQSSSASDKENMNYRRSHKNNNLEKKLSELERTPVRNDRVNTANRTPQSMTSSPSSKISVRSPAEINKKARENYLRKEADQDSMKGSNSGAKESSSCEQDSLMNITQHQLLLKQFEEDLFNPRRVQTSPKTRKSQSPRNSQEKNQQANSNRDPSTKDIEYSSAEEDDIVMSTPNAKTISSNSTTRGNVTSVDTTPILKIAGEVPSPNEVPRNRVTANNGATLNEGRTIRSPYEKTPKAQRTSSSDASSTCSSVLGQARRPWFICSGLSSAQIKQVQELSLFLKATYTSQFHHDVTHVIMKVDRETNTADKTVKYLQGVAHRKWVIGFEWVEECLRQKQLVDEEPYEVLDSGSFEAGPRNSRLRQSGLFKDFAFFCFGPYVNISAEQYKDLLSATGGEVAETLEALAASTRKFRIIVVQPDSYEYKIIGLYQKARAVPVADDWIIECIGRYRLISFYAHLQELLPQDVLALGYPDYLIEEVDDNTDLSQT